MVVSRCSCLFQTYYLRVAAAAGEVERGAAVRVLAVHSGIVLLHQPPNGVQLPAQAGRHHRGALVRFRVAPIDLLRIKTTTATATINHKIQQTCKP